MSRKNAKVKVRAEEALSALRGGSVWIVAMAVMLSSGVGAVNASDCDFGWDPDIGDPGMGSEPKPVLTFTWYNDGLGGGLELYAGGYIIEAGGDPVQMIAKWDGGSNWSALPGDFWFAPFPVVASLTTWFNPVRKNLELYFGGSVVWIDQEANVFNHVGSWDGVNLYPISDNGTIGVDGNDMRVSALTVFQDDLYAAGSFQTAGGTVVNNIARWDGSAWHTLTDADTGVTGIDPGGRVLTMLRFDDGVGDALYVGGAFSSAGGYSVDDIAKWDGTRWSSVGGGLLGGVHVLHEHKIGIQTHLYAGGGFFLPGGEASIARLDSGAWVPVGGGFNNMVYALATLEEGDVCGEGPKLFAGGAFGAFWDGQSWIDASRIAKWDGTEWAPLLANDDPDSNGVDGTVWALTSGANDDRQNESSLYLGGAFNRILVQGEEVEAFLVAEWSCTGCIWDLDGDEQINPVDSGLVQQQFGCPVGTGIEDCDKADIDGDCQVNPVDSGIVQSHFGEFCPQ